jgi:DivIVA domain-containing protein
MLTPDNVLAKQFTSTQFRRGYNENEVDDFLDQVAAAMRETVAAHEAELALMREETERLRTAALGRLREAAPPAADGAAIIALAQKLHDQHVADGQTALEQARERAAGIVAQATGERDALAGQIRDLHTERADVRDGLRMFFREQMAALDATFPEA